MVPAPRTAIVLISLSFIMSPQMKDGFSLLLLLFNNSTSERWGSNLSSQPLACYLIPLRKEPEMPEKYAFIPSPELVAQSNVQKFMNHHRIKDYHELVKRSTADITWFWEAVVKQLELEFFEPYEKVLDESEGIAWAKWFVGGRINIAHNCLDRHDRSERRDRPALIWEGEDGAVRRLSYHELTEGTNRLANALKSLGVAQGDRVGVFLPMIPETAMALLACAKIGAIFIPIFSGFGPQAVAARLNDGQAKL
ncbi:MAG TPA: hypothetical protein ENI60_06070, partial [Candidatus Fraserbacteria bacterium]|nr:hypothetical protein [Candidatus Fraserbacteria bacterium]